MLRGLVGATGCCFSYTHLSDLILSSFWTSDPQQVGAGLTGQSTWMWWFHMSPFWLLWVMLHLPFACYISPLPGTCHLQPSHPPGFHNSKSILIPCVLLLPGLTVLYVVPPRRDCLDLLTWSTKFFLRRHQKGSHASRGSGHQNWLRNDTICIFWLFYSFLNILSIWFTCLTRNELR